MMKRLFYILTLSFIFAVICSPVFSQEKDEQNTEVKASKGGLAEVPAPKRPRPVDKEKAEEAAKKDETPEDEESHRNTIKYGIPSEIGTLLDELIKNDDPRLR